MICTLHPGPVLGACLALLACPAAAEPVVIDFDELGNFDEVYCGSVGNVNYCDVNKYLYGHVGSYLFLSDYDFFATTEITADPGTYFTPVGFEVDGDSTVWRAPCPECAELTEAEVFDLVWYGAPGELGAFEVYEYEFFAVEGYRDGALVARSTIGEEGFGSVELGTDFAAIDRLRFDLLGAYFEDARYEEDGYLYICLLNEYYYCNEAWIDDLVVRTNVAPAPIPLGASGTALAGGLALLAGVGAGLRWRVGAR